MQGVEQQVHFELEIVVIGKGQRNVCKAESVHLACTTYTPHYGRLAVGNEIHRLVLLRPIIVVLGHHQPVARLQFLLTPQNLCPYALIIKVGTLVAAAHDDGLVHSVSTVASLQCFYQFASGQHPDVGKTTHTDFGQTEAIVLCNQLTQAGSIPQDARLLLLPDHLRQVRLHHLQPVPPQRIGTERRTLLLAEAVPCRPTAAGGIPCPNRQTAPDRRANGPYRKPTPTVRRLLSSKLRPLYIKYASSGCRSAQSCSSRSKRPAACISSYEW